MVLQKESSNYERQLVALGRALQAIREESRVDGAIKVALEHIHAEFDYLLVWMGLYDRVEHRLSGKGGFCADTEAILLKQRFGLNPGDVMEQVVIQQRPLGIPDLREESRAGEWRQLAQRFGIQGTLLLPIRHKDRCFGVLMLGSNLWGTSPHAEEKARLSMISGGLAEALYQFEMEQQRRQAKRPDEPLFNLLTKIRSLPSLKKRLEAIVDETHRFVAPNRTNIYWYEPQQRFFWRRLGNRTADVSEEKLAVQDLGSFYQALSGDQLVAIGEAHSLKADATGRLMQLLQARSLIAAPILHQGELKGFLTAEGHDARIWLDEEKNYLRGVAQLIALTAPLEEMEQTVQQVKQDQQLTAEVTRAIYSDSDWRMTLKRCADQVLRRLNAERFLVLLYSSDLKQFEICYQQQPLNRRPIALPLEALNPVDWQMLERSSEAVGIENLAGDLKLMAWRQVFLDLEVQSLLVCNSAIGKPIEGLVVIGHEASRSWSRTERDLLKVVSQQIGLLLHQFQLQNQTEQLRKTYQAVQWGLTALQQMQQLERLEKAAVQHIAQLLQSPLASLITWQPGQATARITAPLFAKPQFGLDSTAVVSLSDPLLQAALQSDSLLPLPIADLSPETRQWLNGSELGQVLVYTLRTAPEHEPTGIILVADQANRVWLQHQMSAFGVLVNQLAWCRRSIMLADQLLAQRSSLEQLNWYKHRRLEELYRVLGVGVRRLNELGQQKDALSSMRYQQVLRHLGNTLTTTTPILRQEQWQLQTDRETIPLASLLKRSLERLDGLIKQRQLWTQVHNEASLSLGGDIAKIEYIVHEILTSASLRSPMGGRLDIWCRQIDAQWLEMSITDNGGIDAQLIEQMELGRGGRPAGSFTARSAAGLAFRSLSGVNAPNGRRF